MSSSLVSTPSPAYALLPLRRTLHVLLQRVILPQRALQSQWTQSHPVVPCPQNAGIPAKCSNAPCGRNPAAEIRATGRSPCIALANPSAASWLNPRKTNHRVLRYASNPRSAPSEHPRQGEHPPDVASPGFPAAAIQILPLKGVNPARSNSRSLCTLHHLHGPFIAMQTMQ